MAFNPYQTPKYNIADPYGTSPSSRLAAALAKSSMGQKQARTSYNRDKFDMSKQWSKAVPQLEAGMARRGLQDSGIRNLALAEAGADYDRRRAERGGALEQAMFNLAVQRLGDYGGYQGSRFEDVLGVAASRAARAAEIREAMA